MTVRNKGRAGQETLVWNAENRLSEVRDSNGDMVEQYWYDVGGARVKKVSGLTTTYTFFAHYEEEVTNGVTTTISHYSFGSLRVAIKRGSILFHLHGDHLCSAFAQCPTDGVRSGFGSTSLTTRGASMVARRAYYAYGAKRAALGNLRTDRTFTGQKADATGLMYYNARYYDPNLGTFISPDSLVPDASRVIDYNRFLYARGNPLKYSDPTRHDPLGEAWQKEFEKVHGRRPEAEDRRDRLASLATPGGVSGRRSWTDADWKHYANNKRQVLTKVVAKAGVKTQAKGAIEEAIVDHNVTSQEDTNAGSSPQGWGDKLKRVASNIIHALIPPGGTSVGVTSSTGVVLDVTGETGVFFDKSGDSHIGLAIGVGGNTGANVDAGFYIQNLPWASGAGAMEGWTVNLGLSVGEGGAGGIEVNFATDPETGDPIFGVTVTGTLSAKANLSFPPVELYGNATHTSFIYESNFFDLLGSPRPEQ